MTGKYYRYADGRYAHSKSVNNGFGGHNCLHCGAASAVRCGDADRGREELGYISCPFMRKGNSHADYLARRHGLV